MRVMASSPAAGLQSWTNGDAAGLNGAHAGHPSSMPASVRPVSKPMRYARTLEIGYRGRGHRTGN